MANLIDDIGKTQSSYCYPDTNILINKKNIKNEDKLNSEEKIITAYKLAILNSGDYSNIKQTWDVNHYLSIHKFLFDELYAFAGQFRKEDICKGKWFCDIRFMSINLNETLNEMNKNVKKIKGRDDLLLFLSKYFLDINIIHPFREGNGRTLREFLREYVDRINELNGFNYEINYSLITGELKNKYLYASVKDDERLMMQVFDNILVEKELEHEKNIHK